MDLIAPPKITVDTKGTCLFCLKPKKSCHNANYTCFSFFLQYLEIDFIKILKRYPSVILEHIGDENMSIREVEAVLCEECDILMKEFVNWYFENETSGLDNCVQHLHSVLQASDELKVILGSHSHLNSEHCKVAYNLRKEMLQKCSLKLQSFPTPTASNVVNLQNLHSTEEEIRQVGRNPGKKSQIRQTLKQETSRLLKFENSKPLHNSGGIAATPIEGYNETTNTANFNPLQISLNSDIPFEIHSSFCHPGLKSHYELQEEIFRNVLRKLPDGTTLLKIDEAIGIFLARNGKHSLDHPLRCTIPHEGDIYLGRPFPTEIDFRVHMFSFHIEEVSNQLVQLLQSQGTTVNQNNLSGPLIQTPEVEDRINQQNLTTLPCLLESSSKKFACPLCSKMYSSWKYIFEYHIVMMHTSTYLRYFLPPNFTEEELHDTLQRELWKGSLVNIDGSVSHYLCMYCATRIQCRADFKCHLLLHHPDDVVETAEGLRLERSTRRRYMLQ